MKWELRWNEKAGDFGGRERKREEREDDSAKRKKYDSFLNGLHTIMKSMTSKEWVFPKVNLIKEIVKTKRESCTKWHEK